MCYSALVNIARLFIKDIVVEKIFFIHNFINMWYYQIFFYDFLFIALTCISLGISEVDTIFHVYWTL